MLHLLSELELSQLEQSWLRVVAMSKIRRIAPPSRGAREAIQRLVDAGWVECREERRPHVMVLKITPKGALVWAGR